LFIPVWRGKSGATNGSVESYRFDGATSSDLRIVILGEKAAVVEVVLPELP
jgi:beta-glucosidase